MPTPNNSALWPPAKRAAFRSGPAPYTRPGPKEVVLRNRAVAVNPFDRLMQTVGDLITSWIRYPFIVGSDVAGEVVEIGSEVTRFRVGDRAVGFAAGADPKRNKAAEGAFQHYSVVLEHMAAPLPESVSFEAASVLPLAISTAACGMFQEDFLAMAHPCLDNGKTGQTLLVWGGSTSVGCNAIQLAVAAGYEVVTTCSPRNFEFARELGACAVFDYNSPTVVRDLIAALKGRRMAGALAIGAGSAKACVDILAACEGTRFVAMATPAATFDDVPAGRGRLVRLIPVLARIISGGIAVALKGRRTGVRSKMIWGSALISNNVGPMLFASFLPDALASGRYRAVPRHSVVGHGLDCIPTALDRQRKGVSATKLVVTL